MTPEGKTTAAIVRSLKRRKIWHLKVHGGPFQRAGIPDFLILFQGRAFWVEVKSPDGQLTPLQIVTMRQLVSAGCQTTTVRSVKEFDNWITGVTSDGGDCKCGR